MAFLSEEYGSDHGFRLKRVREFRIVANTAQDGTAQAKMNAALVKTPDMCFYRNKNNTGPLVPQGSYSGEHNKLYDYEPMVIARDAARRGHMQPGPIPRNMGNQTTLIPVSGTLNGVKADSVAAIQRMFMPIGLGELTGRDTATPGGTAIMGGIVTMHNSLPYTLYTGDYVMAVPPTQAEAHALQAADGNAANENGRVPWVLKKFSPGDIDFGRDGHVRHVLATRVLEVKQGGLLGFKPDAKARASLNNLESSVDVEFTRTLKQLIEGYVESNRHLVNIRGGLVPDDEVEVLTDAAAKFVVLAGSPKLGTEHVTKFLSEIELGENATAAHRETVRGSLIDLMGNALTAEIYRNDPIAKQVRALATCKREFEDACMGIMVIGAKGKKNGDIHLRAYAH